MCELSEYAAAIDIGTTKVTVLVVIMEDVGNLKVAGLGNVQYSSSQKNIFHDETHLKSALIAAIKQAQSMAGVTIPRIVLGIPGKCCGLVKNNSEVSLERGRVSSKDVKKAVDETYAYPLPQEWKVIQSIPHYYWIDDGQPVKNPIRKQGYNLNVLSSLICGERNFINQITDILASIKIHVDKVKSVPVACGGVLLTEEEKHNGSLLLDIGGKATSYIFYKDDVPILMDWLPVGGWNITNDISIGLDIPFEEAEKLKRQCVLGLDLNNELNDDPELHMPVKVGMNTYRIPLGDVHQIVEARIDEIFQMVRDNISSQYHISISDYSIVLTGGGVSLLRGSKEFAADAFECPVRLGVPDAIGVSNPALSSVFALLAHKEKTQDFNKDNPLYRSIKKVKEYYRRFFY